MQRLRPADASDDWIGARVVVHIDRPVGSRHPRFAGLIYPVHYGHVPGTMAADGHKIDAYLLGVTKPVARFEDRCVAIVHRRDDIEDKLIVVPEGLVMGDAEIAQSVQFQERYFQTVLIR
ncbi:MAG: inorganic diphosphatase [Pseudomonadota bacterium]